MPPLEFASGGEAIYYHRRSFCDCPAGSRKRHAEREATVRAERDERIKDVMRDSGLNTGRYERFTFKTWNLGLNAPYSKQASDTTREYLTHVAEPNNWLFIYGPYGTGKTHLAIAALRTLAIDHLWSAKAIVWPELCQATKETWRSTHGPTEAQLWGRVRSARILLIDDIDKNSTTEWAMGKLYGLINSRLNRNLPTIITANKSPDDLRRKWYRGKDEAVRDLGLSVLSRIAEGMWGGVQFRGEDQRWKK